jgi:hypothetical protein
VMIDTTVVRCWPVSSVITADSAIARERTHPLQ